MLLTLLFVDIFIQRLCMLFISPVRYFSIVMLYRPGLQCVDLGYEHKFHGNSPLAARLLGKPSRLVVPWL